MFNFESKQQVFEIGGTRVGGLPGENATVMVGSIFFHKDKTVLDAKSGKFDKSKAEHFIKIQEEFSDKTGLPGMLDVVGTTPQAIEQFLEFLVDVTNMPLLIDGAGSNEVNIAGLRYSKQQGFSDRILLNSIVPETPPEVLNAMHESGVTSAILLTYSSMAVISSSKRVELVEELVEKAKKANVTNFMVDTVVLDIPTLGLAIKALREIKNKYGLPAGCGAHNSVDTWRGLKTKMGTQAIIPSLVAANIVGVSGGADFLLYGPVEHAPYIFPPVAMVDTALSQILMEQGIKPGKEHPRRKIG